MDEIKSAQRFDEAAESLGKISNKFRLTLKEKAAAQEIRMRIGKPVMISLPNGSAFIRTDGTLSNVYSNNLLTAWQENMQEAFNLICNYSVHSHQREIKNGFVTIKGGHRAGICGTAVTENDTVSNIRDISSINLRIARDIEGAAKDTAKFIVNGEKVFGAIIFGPPGCGKTTVLRDLARRLSKGTQNNKYYRVSVIDERGEIAACFQGSAQNDLGPSCDVLDGYPKGEGIMQAVRCLSPDVVICDEIGSEEDAKAIEMSINAGVSIIASAHAGNINELLSRPQIKRLLKAGAFKCAVKLYGREAPGTVEETYDENHLKELLR